MSNLKDYLSFQKDYKYIFNFYATEEKLDFLLRRFNSFKSIDDKLNYVSYALLDSKIFSGYKVKENLFSKVEAITEKDGNFYWCKIVLRNKDLEITIGAINECDLEEITKSIVEDYNAIKFETINSKDLEANVLEQDEIN